MERAILVSAARKTDDKRAVDAHLEELAQLVDTAGALVVGVLTQRVDRPNPATLLGSGKVEELDALIKATNATLVVFDDELTPAQGKNLEDAVATRVVDRAELILDIFAIRARTAEARMQVELAQLEYTLPRLTRMWTHLEKFRGGIGVRGPGETQLETDRRLINKRIRLLKQKLEEVRKARAVQRSGRGQLFRVALVGYTNAGKSSLLRGLSGANEVFVEDRLFATLDPLTREVDIGGRQILVTDTVGFIRKLPHHLVASFRATLEEVQEADLLLHVVDASSEEWASQVDVVDTVLAELGVAHKPLLYVFNKVDRLSAAEAEGLRQRLASGSARDNEADGDAVLVSAVTAGGLEPLRLRLLEMMRKARPVTEVRVPVGDGRLIAQLHRETEVLDQRAEGDVLVMHARMDDSTADRLRHRGYVAGGQ